MPNFQTERQTYHSDQTRKVMKRITYRCPACRRGQNKRPIDISLGGPPEFLKVCVYCEHEWKPGAVLSSGLPE